MSKIEWTEQTWNPIVGCSIVSPGCTNCYAMKMADRLQMMSATQFPHYQGTTKRVNGKPVWTGKMAMAPEATLLAPLKRKKPTMYFVNSMSDLFHEDVPDEWIDRVFAVMALTPQHTYQVLTKRSARMRNYMAQTSRFETAVHELGRALNCGDSWRGRWTFPLRNVWLGVSAERQQEADARIPDLLATRAAVRFVSAEPLLGPISFRQFMPVDRWYNAICEKCGFVGSTEFFSEARNHDDADVVCPKCERIILADEVGRLDWTIVGGESGPNARPLHPDWARSIRDQCVGAGVAFFFKQWGSEVPVQEIRNSEWMYRRTTGKGHRILDGREWNEYPDRQSAIGNGQPDGPPSAPCPLTSADPTEPASRRRQGHVCQRLALGARDISRDIPGT